MPLCNEDNCLNTQKCKNTTHAEHMAIISAARKGISLYGTTLTVSCSPCFDCAGDILLAGIQSIEYFEEYRDNSGLILLGKNIEVLKCF